MSCQSGLNHHILARSGSNSVDHTCCARVAAVLLLFTMVILLALHESQLLHRLICAGQKSSDSADKCAKKKGSLQAQFTCAAACNAYVAQPDLLPILTCVAFAIPPAGCSTRVAILLAHQLTASSLGMHAHQPSSGIRLLCCGLPSRPLVDVRFGIVYLPLDLSLGGHAGSASGRLRRSANAECLLPQASKFSSSRV